MDEQNEELKHAPFNCGRLCSIGECCDSSPEGYQTDLSARDESLDVPATVSPADSDKALKEFSYKAEKLTGCGLLFVIYLTNWWSMYNGHPQCWPEALFDAAVGLALGGFGAQPYHQFLLPKLKELLNDRSSN